MSTLYFMGLTLFDRTLLIYNAWLDEDLTRLDAFSEPAVSVLSACVCGRQLYEVVYSIQPGLC